MYFIAFSLNFFGFSGFSPSVSVALGPLWGYPGLSRPPWGLFGGDGGVLDPEFKKKWVCSLGFAWVSFGFALVLAWFWLGVLGWSCSGGLGVFGFAWFWLGLAVLGPLWGSWGLFGASGGVLAALGKLDVYSTYTPQAYTSSTQELRGVCSVPSLWVLLGFAWCWLGFGLVLAWFWLSPPLGFL